MKYVLLLVVAAVSVPAPAVLAQTTPGLFERWRTMSEQAEAREPHWATPLITNTPLLDQTLRADFQHSTQAGNTSLWNLGASKGLKVIVAPRLEIDVNPAPYFIYEPSPRKDGFGDVSFLAKYRIFARPAAHGDAVLTAFFGGTYPTGAYTNGAANATVSPTLAGGKGFGPFALESTLGATLPTQGTATAGRTITWNTAGLFRTGPHLTAELESNASFAHGGKNDGTKQEFVTPGLIARFRNESRRGITFAAGMQFATTHAHTNDHVLVLSTRLHF